MGYTRKVLLSGVHREVEHEGVGRFALYTDVNRLTTAAVFVEEAMQGQGFARKMMKEVLGECAKEKFKVEFVYIDTDASSGFWDHVGFVPNPLCEDETSIYFGYEKRISWRALRKFAA